MSASTPSPRRLRWLAAGLLVALAPFARAQSPDDIHWDDRFPILQGAFGGGTYAASGGRLYATGGFPCTADGSLVCGIGIWEAGHWRFVGPILPGEGFDFTEVSGAGDNVYVGGNFTSINGQPFNFIALWNGTQWTALGSGLNDVPQVFFDEGAGLYVGGDFTMAGGATARRVALWNGVGWFPLIDANAGNGVNSTVRAITTTGSHLILGGDFTSAGGVTGVGNIVRWNAVSLEWTRMGTGLNNRVRALGASGATVLAAGDFTLAGDGSGPDLNHVAAWTGTAWGTMGQGTSAGGSVAHLYGTPAGFAYGVGNFSAEGGATANGLGFWTGGPWAPVGPGLAGGLANNGFLVGEGNVVYAGPGILADGRNMRGLGRWDGASWQGLQNGVGVHFEDPVNNHVAAFAHLGGQLYAGGRFQYAGAEPASQLARWNGSAWAPVGNANLITQASIRALAARGSDLFAAGSFTTIGGVTANGVARWDGAAWSALASGVTGGPFALLADGSDLYLGGTITQAGSQPVGLIARWDGAAWHPLGTGLWPGGRIYSMVRHAGRIYVSGQFSLLGDGTTQAINVASWDGAAWAAVGAGVGSGFDDVPALAVYGGQLYAARRTTGGGTGSLHRLDGATWTSVATFDREQVNALFANGTDLYVGGNFTAVQGVPAARVAHWNGSAWSPLGSGLANAQNGQDNVHALLGTTDGLWAGGTFATAGGKPSGNIARWDDFVLQPTAAEPGAPGATGALSPIRPNPFATSASFTVTVERPERVRLAVYDVLGREVALLHDGLLAGARAFALDGAGLAPGVYVVQAAGETFVTTRRVALAR